ncbi:MAG: hypothetical protein LH473_11825 [Chitinophagales bacterium]|nr:hypothetical protein [Chitinophagales bacterium]
MSTAEIILLIIYIVLFSAVILKTRFFSNSSLASSQIVFIFIIKIIAGIFYGYVHRIYYGGGDTMEYFVESKFITDRLADHDYVSFIKLLSGINQRPPAPDIKEYALAIGYWNDMSSYFIIRFHAIARLLSFGYYNVHVVFYNFITLVGLLFLFRFFNNMLPSKKYFIAAIIFFFPSVLFFSSGIHKDGVALAALGFILFFIQKLNSSFSINENEKSSLLLQRSFSIIGLLIGLWLMLVVRIFWLLLLIPYVTALIINLRFPKKPLIKYLLIAAVYFGIAVNLNSFFPDLDFLNIIVLKQREFLSIPQGNHALQIPSLIPSIQSILLAIPNALGNCILEPGITNLNSPFEWMASFENVLIMMLAFICFFERKKICHKLRHHYFSFAFSFPSPFLL